MSAERRQPRSTTDPLVLILTSLVLAGALACGEESGGLKADTPSDFCPGTPVLEAELPRTLEGDRYLSREIALYSVVEDLAVNGGALCVEPGVTVEVAQSRRIVIGSETSAALIAVGVDEDGASAPITFTSARSVPRFGDWDKILFTSKADAARSRLQNVVIEYAGAHIQHGRCGLTVESNTLEMDQVTVRKGLGMGVIFEGADAYPTGFTDMHFEEVPEGAFSISARYAHKLAGPITLGMGVPRSELRGGTIYDDTTLQDLGVPVDIVGDNVLMANGAVLSIDPGVTLRLGSGQRLVAGGTTEGGIEFLGTFQAPILVTTWEQDPHPGSWDKILVTPKTIRAVFQHVVLEYGGQLSSQGGKAALLIGGGVDDIDGLEILSSGGFGLFIQTGAPLPTVGGPIRIEASVDDAISMPPELVEFLMSSTLELTGEPAVIRLREGDLSGTVELAGLGATIRVEGELRVDDGSWRLAPGEEVIFEPGARLSVGLNGDGELIAVGTESSPVRFSSASGEPAPGDWDGIILGASTGAGARLEHCRVEYGGGTALEGSKGANLSLLGCAPLLRSVSLGASAGHGLYLDAEASPDMDDSLSFDDIQGEDIFTE